MAELAQVLVFLMWSETWFLSICLTIFAPEATSPGRWAMREQLRARRCARAYRGKSWWPRKTCLLVGGLEHFFFPYTGNNHPNWLSYVSEGLKPPIKSKNRRRSIMATSIEWLIIATWKTDLSDPRFPPHAADALHTFGTDGTLAEDGCCPGWWILQVIPLWLGGKLLTTLVRYGQHSGKSLVPFWTLLWKVHQTLCSDRTLPKARPTIVQCPHLTFYTKLHTCKRRN